MQKITRKAKGEEYFFINARLVPYLTHDWYFGTDDERFKKGNYFLTREAAYDCAEDLVEFGKRLEKNQDQREDNDRDFINTVRDLFKLKRKTSDELVDATVEAIRNYDDRKAELKRERTLIAAKIDKVILLHVKE